MERSADTTRSMEIKANAVKRFTITVLKLFRICCSKKHKKPPDDTKSA